MRHSVDSPDTPDEAQRAALRQIAAAIPAWAQALGFQSTGIAEIALDEDAQHLRQWLARHHHGSMQWMATHADLRAAPEQLHAGTIRVVSARMDYLPGNAVDATRQAWDTIHSPSEAYVARYALGRDYHKLIRKRLKQLGQRIQAAAESAGLTTDQRPFVDSAPVLEKALGRDARLGWIGKHTLLLHRDAGSYFFIGELLTNLPLPASAAPPSKDLCGSCTACMRICPTDAIIGPRQLDARRCIAYLTIESRDAIPLAMRKPMGNRIFGCDDCQLACPWNRYAQASTEPDFAPRHALDSTQLLTLWAWSEDEFLRRTEGMAIRRTGWDGWRRNLAVALGNQVAEGVDVAAAKAALRAALPAASALVAEHITWALEQAPTPG